MTYKDKLKYRVIELRQFNDHRGSLSFIEEDTHLPFKIKRVSWITNMLGTKYFEGCEFKHCQVLILNFSGNFDVSIGNRKPQQIISLSSPFYGIHIHKNIYWQIQNISENAIAFIISSCLDKRNIR